MNEIIPTQIMGETSTPPTGGTSERVGFSSGSVGTYATTHGSLVYGTEGYQVITMRTMNMIVAMLKNGPSAPATALAVSGSRGSEAASCVTRLDAVATAARASSDSAAAASGANKAAGEDCVMRCGGGVEGQRANPNTGSAGWSSFDRRRRRIVNVQGCADGRGRTATAASAALRDLADAHAGMASCRARARGDAAEGRHRRADAEGIREHHGMCCCARKRSPMGQHVERVVLLLSSYDRSEPV